MEQGVLYAQKARHQAEFHARVHAKALAAGYGLRRTNNGVELSVWRPDETRIFCKRTDQIEKELDKQKRELRERTAAIVNEAANHLFAQEFKHIVCRPGCIEICTLFGLTGQALPR